MQLIYAYYAKMNNIPIALKMLSLYYTIVLKSLCEILIVERPHTMTRMQMSTTIHTVYYFIQLV